MKEFILNLGGYFLSILESVGDVVILFYRTLYASIRPPFDFRLVVQELDDIGFKSIPIVVVSSIAIGMVMVVQLAWGFAFFGAKGVIGPIVTLAFVRELGPVLASLLVAGRVGSGITAEIGSMQVTEQIDAIRSLGADPIKKLVVPRFIAALVSFPFLAVIADLSGMIGAMIMADIELGVKPRLFLSSMEGFVTLTDFFSGILKTVFFGIFVSIIGCYVGINTEGGTEGVGRATTLTVVISMVLIIVGDFFLTKLFLIL
jgi:phospholipid/cholesterol/gamma-HCH transport system permease protein